MSTSHKTTLATVFASSPAARPLMWADVEGLIVALGGAVSGGADGRLRVTLYGRRGSFQPSGSELTSGALNGVRDLLRRAGIRPDQ